MIYWMILFLPFLVHYTFGRRTFTNKGVVLNEKIYFGFFSLIFVFVLGFRDVTVGIDTGNYLSMFNRVNDASDFWQYLVEFTEGGYITIQKIVGFIGLDFNTFLFIVAIITVIPIMIVIKKYSYNPSFSIFLYVAFGFYTFALSAIRQGLAISICCLSVIYIDKQKFWKYLVCILVASSIHMTAMIFFPAYFLSKFKFGARTLSIASSVIVLGYVFKSNILNTLNSYARIDYGVSDVGGEMQYLFMVLVVILGLIYSVKIKEDSKMFSFFYYCMMASMFILPIVRVNPTLLRLYSYYYIFIIIFAPNLIYLVKDKYIKLLLSAGFVFVGVYFFYTQIITADLKIIPYRVFW